MDTTNMYHGLTFLAWTSAGFLIIVGLFLVKVLFDLSSLLTKMNQTADIVKDSAKPIFADITESVSIVNKYVKRADTDLTKFNDLSGKASKIIVELLSKTSAVSGIIAKGLWNIIKSFKKK